MKNSLNLQTNRLLSALFLHICIHVPTHTPLQLIQIANKSKPAYIKFTCYWALEHLCFGYLRKARTLNSQIHCSAYSLMTYYLLMTWLVTIVAKHILYNYIQFIKNRYIKYLVQCVLLLFYISVFCIHSLLYFFAILTRRSFYDLFHTSRVTHQQPSTPSNISPEVKCN